MGLYEVDVRVEAPPTDWIVEGFCARGAVTMIAGEAGGGKSMLTQAFAAAVSGGQENVAGFKVKPGKVDLVDAENGPNVIRRRFNANGGGGRRLKVHAAEDFDIEENLDELKAITRGADLIILDSWKSLWSGSENSVGQVKRCLQGLRDMARENSAGVILIHHTTKDGKSYRGSSAIAATIEAVFTFTKEGGTKRKLTCQKMRLDAEPGEKLMRLTSTGTVVASSGGETDESEPYPTGWVAVRGGTVVARGARMEDMTEDLLTRRLLDKVRYVRADQLPMGF